nr:MAG TPA: hypothetical protein [Caudoviricetes sp.]
MSLLKKLFGIKKEEKTQVNKDLQPIANALQRIKGVVKYELTENAIYIIGLDGEPFVEITKDYKYNYVTFYIYRRLSDNFEYFNYDDVIESYIYKYYKTMTPIKMSDGRYCYHEHGDVDAFKINKKGQLVCKYCENIIPRREEYINAD